MIERYDDLSREHDLVAQVKPKDETPSYRQRLREVSGERYDIELTVIATPVHTHRGLSRKRQMIKRSDWRVLADKVDLHALLDEILRQDAVRVREAEIAAV